MIPLVTDFLFTAITVLVVVLMIATVIFFLYDTVVTFIRGQI